MNEMTQYSVVDAIKIRISRQFTHALSFDSSIVPKGALCFAKEYFCIASACSLSLYEFRFQPSFPAIRSAKKTVDATHSNSHSAETNSFVFILFDERKDPIRLCIQ